MLSSQQSAFDSELALQQSKAVPSIRIVHNYKPKHTSFGSEDPGYYKRCAKLTVVWFALSSIVIAAENCITDYDTQLNAYESLYYRIYVNTTWFPLSQFLVYMAMNVVGWMYVNRVNMQRKDPFTSGNGGHEGFKKLMILFAPLMYFMSGNVVRRQAHDLSGYCEQTNDMVALTMLRDSNMIAPHELSHSISDSTLRLFHSIGELNLAGENTLPECHVYTNMELFKYNYLIWTLGFFAGLQWTHFDVGPFSRLTLDWDTMKTWGKGMWELFAVVLVAICSTVYVTFHGYYAIGILKWYICWGVFVIGFIVLKTKLESKTHLLHIHHYFWASIIVSFLCYQSIFITLASAFFNGVVIEGGAHWGFDPIWIPKVSQEKLMKSKPREEIEDELMDKFSHTTTHRKAWIQRKAHQEKIRRANGDAVNYQVQTGQQVMKPVLIQHPSGVVNGPPVFKTDNNYLKKIESELPSELVDLLNKEPVIDFSANQYAQQQQQPINVQPTTIITESQQPLYSSPPQSQPVMIPQEYSNNQMY